jgi:riboflavin synthase
MFTGIVEALAKVEAIEKEGTNVHYTFSCPFTQELKIDQSVAHNGVCLTVVKINGSLYTLTAIKETLDKSNLGGLKVGDEVNLERCMKVGDRLDGHIVQGHVDGIGECISLEELNGSWEFRFKHKPKDGMTVEKGSITVNGTSLTVINSTEDEFSVAIIPYTFEHTVFKHINEGSKVNLEFDIVGKYIQKMQKA